MHLTHARCREFRGQILYAVPSMFLDELPEEVERINRSGGFNTARSAIDEWRAKAGYTEPGSAIPIAAKPFPTVIPDNANGDYTAGQVVQHEQYGIGKISDVSGFGALRKLKIRFAAAGEKTFVADKVKLRVVKTSLIREVAAMPIVPVAKSLYICDYHIGFDDGKVDLYGIFNAIRPPEGFPHHLTRFCLFAQLCGGLGEIPFYFDIRHAQSGELVHTTLTNRLIFSDRITVVQLVMEIESCPFPRPGLYFIELFCDNTWVCDVPLKLLEGDD